MCRIVNLSAEALNERYGRIKRCLRDVPSGGHGTAERRGDCRELIKD
jgi:hypothetical protein